MTIFKTKVIAIGQDAEDFKQENMLLFFGEDAPPELSDFCYKIT
ncbi:MAG: PTS glucitol/sorbitol transporter subunit IIA, partial [Enterococcus sp.]